MSNNINNIITEGMSEQTKDILKVASGLGCGILLSLVRRKIRKVSTEKKLENV